MRCFRTSSEEESHQCNLPRIDQTVPGPPEENIIFDACRIRFCNASLSKVYAFFDRLRYRDLEQAGQIWKDIRRALGQCFLNAALEER